MTNKDVPLFPLRTVLFPDGPLPLRVFEPRYLDMVSRCMKDSEPFGVVLLSDGSEAGGSGVVATRAIGTLATIYDWYQGTDGLLGITARGGERFELGAIRQADDGLNYGDIDILPADPEVAVPQEFAPMSGLLRAVIDDLGKLYEAIDKRYDDASWVGFRFAEILPLSLDQKQNCLEMNDAVARLEYLRPLLRQLRQEQATN